MPQDDGQRKDYHQRKDCGDRIPIYIYIYIYNDLFPENIFVTGGKVKYRRGPNNIVIRPCRALNRDPLVRTRAKNDSDQGEK
jgi:hypothetical protein